MSTVTTSSGPIFGTALPASAGGQPVHQFLGVPFASAEKWAAPKDFRTKYASNPYNATMWGDACTQVLTPGVTYGSFDCLAVNVWTPAPAAPQNGSGGKPLPVLVFIYGGSNQFGEAEPYNSSAIAAFHETVTVNFNYRTGPYGWMAFAEDVAAGRSTGNFGILDIQSALRWVQREIGAFGGDPTRVAIHGQSSGGGLVELQYVAPHSVGLFHAAISESGGLGAAALDRALNNTAKCASRVGCLGDDGRVSKACMRAARAANITDLTYVGDWSPTVDGVTFPQDPALMLAEGLVHPGVAVVLGSQTNDSFLFLSEEYTRGNASQPNNATDGELLPINASEYVAQVSYELGDAERQDVDDALRLYPPADERDPAKGSIRNVHSLGRMESDRMSCGLRRRAALLHKANPGRAFVYRFNYWYQSNANCFAVPNFHLDYLGAVHQDEVTFVMGQPNFMEDGSCCGKWGLSEGAEGCAQLAKCTMCYDDTFGEGYAAYFNAKEFRFARLIGTYWTNFAASGDPNTRDGVAAAGTAELNPWPTVAGGAAIVLDANDEGGSTVEEQLFGDAAICKLWDALAARASARKK